MGCGDAFETALLCFGPPLEESCQAPSVASEGQSCDGNPGFGFGISFCLHGFTTHICEIDPSTGEGTCEPRPSTGEICSEERPCDLFESFCRFDDTTAVAPTCVAYLEDGDVCSVDFSQDPEPLECGPFSFCVTEGGEQEGVCTAEGPEAPIQCVETVD